MPYISVRTTCDVDSATELQLKTELGQAISKIPGKDESWLMVDIAGGCKLYFKGDNSKPIVYSEVKIFGKASKEAYAALTAELCRVFEKTLGVPQDRAYVKYEECSLWGWNGSNF